MAIVETVDGVKIVTVKIVIPLPFPKLPSIPISFPPTLPSLKLPTAPPALEALAKVLARIQKIVDKILTLIPQASVHLIVKLGRVTIIDEVISTPTVL